MLVLRPTTETDLAFVLAAERHPDNRPYVGQWSKEQHLAALANPDMAHLIAEREDDGQPVGYAILAGLGPDSTNVELKRVVATAKGQGIGRSMLQTIKRYAFEDRHAHRLWLDVRDHNLRAQHLYASEGFTVEGRLRECVLVDGRYESLIVMSILAREYHRWLRHDDVLLRPWQVADAKWYVEARDEEIFRWTTEPRTLMVEETVAAIQAINERPDVSSFAIVDLNRHQLVGNIAAVKDDRHPQEAEVMYWLAESGRGRGIATKALQLLCSWAFTELKLERLTLKTYIGNVRSQQVAARAGFREFRPADGDGEEREFSWYELTKQNLNPDR